MNHILLHLLMLSLRDSHHGRSIRDISWLDGILSIAFSGEDARCLVAILSRPGPFCYVAIENPLTRQDSRRVFEEIRGAELIGVSVPGADRILQLSFSAQRDPFDLHLSLYGNAGTASLIHGDSRIATLGKSRDRQRAPAVPREAISALVDITQTDLSRYLQTESFTRARVPGLEKELIDAFTPDGGACDAESLIRFRDGLLKGSRSFSIMVPKNINGAFPVPHPPPAGGENETVMGPFTNGTAAGRYIGEQLLEAAFESILDKHLLPLRKRLSAKNGLRSRLREELKQAREYPVLRRETEALAAYQTLVPPGAMSVQLPNPYQAGEKLTIELDPAAPLPHQIKKRFKKASKLERSIPRITSRLKEIDGELASLEKTIASSKRAPSIAAAMQQTEQARLDLRVPSPRRKSQSDREKGKIYRRYDIDKDWFVLVGRDNRENDHITFHIASPEDWWFHAQSVPGSHVVLKSKGGGENPPERILLAAAGIAAYYSKSRHASLVPVIYTRRKYVRKPRKAPPGRVLCEREKTLFAEPILPDPPRAPSEE
ncbi:MAG: NFACT RNA binding domain-containing protein [Candidatus Latescibacterota bacterium]